MPTLTRLALGASAVSALTVLGTALPAAAQTPNRTAPQAPATHNTKPTAGTNTTHVAAERQVGKTTGRPATAKKPGAKKSGAKTHRATPTTSARPKGAQVRPTGKTRAEQAREARGARRSVVLHAITAQRLATAHKPAHQSTHRPTHARVTGGRTSDNWSGYTQSTRDVGRPITSVSASWQVPRAKQHTRGQSDIASDWVGIGGTRSDGASDQSLIQAGTTSTVGRAGVANHYAWFETLPSAAVSTPLSTRSGDRISVAVGRIGTDLWRIRMANATTGRSWSTAVRYASSSNTADFVSERPNTSAGSAELPDRTATSFRHAKVNGTSTHFRPSQRVTMTDNGRAISTPSGPEAQGDGFSVCSYASACGAGSR